MPLRLPDDLLRFIIKALTGLPPIGAGDVSPALKILDVRWSPEYPLVGMGTGSSPSAILDRYPGLPAGEPDLGRSWGEGAIR